MFPSPGKSDSKIHDVRDEEHVDVDIGPMSNNWSEPRLRANSRQNHGVTRSKGRRSGPGRRNEEERCQRRDEERRQGGGSRPGWVDHVIVVVVTDSSSLISVKESKSFDQASGSGSSQAGQALGRLSRQPVVHVAKFWCQLLGCRQ